MLCRSGLALLSAHFEGFIKQAANYYVVYVSSQNIDMSKLQTNFAAIHSKKFLELCGKSEKISVYKKVIDGFLDNYTSKKFQIKYTPDNPIIDTESNPSSNVLRNIFDSVGLDFTPYEIKKNYIDSGLLKNRNSIVHGDRIYINISDFDDTFKVIIDIMNKFLNQILNAAINKSYLRKID